MFTGIVEEIGTITHVDLQSPLDSLRARAPIVSVGTTPGDSISVNGTCLTVTAIDGDTLAFGVMPETVRRTNLGDLVPGETVNLERPLQTQSRLGGHFVQGHVDGIGTVASVQQDGSALAVRIRPSSDIMRYVVEKGFIAVDGASLTVTDADVESFGIALIAFTQEHVSPRMYTEGKSVNLEVDILAKYVERLVVH